jgi:hypothetical protein
MLLSEYRETYHTFSGKASDAARSAAFAGIAIAWLFRNETPGSAPRLPQELLLPTILLAAAIAADLLHYVIAAVVWGSFHRQEEKKLKDVNEDPDLSHPLWRYNVVASMYWIKLLLVIGGYAFLCIFLTNLWMNEPAKSGGSKSQGKPNSPSVNPLPGP